MLDAFIIEEIKRRDEERREDRRPRLELPIPEPTPHRQNDRRDEEGPQRGVVIIDYSGSFGP
jgi:hypothetical protein